MNAKIKKDVRTLLYSKIARTRRSAIDHVVDEIIIGSTMDNIAEQTTDLMGKLTTLDVETTPHNPQAKIDKNLNSAHDMIYDALIDETIRQLIQQKL